MCCNFSVDHYNKNIQIYKIGCNVQDSADLFKVRQFAAITFDFRRSAENCRAVQILRETRKGIRMSERRDYVRTDKMIEEAYLKLLFEKNQDRITVGAVLAEANISRGTFYAHYRDIPDLAEKVGNRMVSAMIDTLSGTTMDRIIENPREQVEKILHAIIKRRDILKAVASISGRPKIIYMMKQWFIQALTKERIAHTKLEKVDIIDACVAGAAFDACLSWITSGNDLSEAELVDTVSDFLAGGLGKIYR